MTKITIWGLKNTRHSHRFIHKGFYENFVKSGYKTNWVDDKSINQEIESKIFFVSGIASKHLKFKQGSTYILHNVDLKDQDLNYIQENKIKFLNLQVYTKDSKGEILDNENTLYDQTTNTLFQPWGTPLLPTEWYEYVPRNVSRIEWWVGAVWNNNLDQGNEKIIQRYKKLLLKNKIIFLKRGGSRFSINGVSDSVNSSLIRKSRFGASIVGDWQYTSSYIPCRLLKNLSFGVPFLSNMQVPKSFYNESGFINNLEELMDFAISEKEAIRVDRFRSSREVLKMFTYSKNIDRIFKILKNGE